MLWKRDKLFCEISPFCYAISLKKEILKRHIRNFFSKEKFAKTKRKTVLANLVWAHGSNMIKRAPGVNLTHQLNKAVNIGLAAEKLTG